MLGLSGLCREIHPPKKIGDALGAGHEKDGGRGGCEQPQTGAGRVGKGMASFFLGWFGVLEDPWGGLWATGLLSPSPLCTHSLSCWWGFSSFSAINGIFFSCFALFG